MLLKKKDLFLIGAVSTKLNISISRLREYEKQNLIYPIRDSNSNRRLYSKEDIQQIKIIHDLIHKHSFTIQSIKYVANEVPCWSLFNCLNKKCPVFQIKHNKCWEYKNDCGMDCKRCIRYINRNFDFKIKGLNGKKL